VRLATHANEDEVWGCGECGHTRLINFGPPPAHKNKLIQEGDQLARHSLGSSCAPELDAAVQLRLTAHPAPAPAADAPRETTDTPRTYSGCGIRWKRKDDPDAT